MRQEAPGRRPAIAGLLLCALVASYFLFTAAYALFHYADFAAANPQFTRYVVAPLLIGMAFVAIGLSRRKWSLLAGIYGISTLAGLFLFESYLTSRQIPIWLGMLGKMSVEQNAAAAREGGVIRGFTLAGLNRRAGDQTLRTSILSGFPSTTVLLCTREKEVVSYRSDRYGFNNPDDAYRGPLSVALLGDSFTEGFCLPPGQDIASQVRERGLATASLGIRGNGPLFELASLGRFGPILAPKHVFLLFFEGNDWENLQNELNEPWLRSALAPGADFGSPSTAGETMSRARASIGEIEKHPVTVADLFIRRATLRNFLALQQTGTALGITYPKIPHANPEFRAVLHRAKSIAAGWNGRFSVLYVPQVDRFLGAFPVDGALDQSRRIVFDAAEKEGVDVIDLTEAFRRQTDPAAMYAADGHFSRDGASFVASLLARDARSHPDVPALPDTTFAGKQ